MTKQHPSDRESLHQVVVPSCKLITLISAAMSEIETFIRVVILLYARVGRSSCALDLETVKGPVAFL